MINPKVSPVMAERIVEFAARHHAAA